MTRPLLVRVRRALVCSLVLGAMGALAPSEVVAATIPVTTTVDDSVVNGNCTLREAITAALSDSAIDACPAGSSSDVVQLGAATYSFTQGFIFVSGVGGPLIVRGPAVTPPTARVSMTPPFAERFMRLLNTADVTLENLQIQNGDVRANQSLKAGGAVAADATQVSLTLRNVWMSGNRALFGGALSFEAGGSSRLLIEDSLFQGNLAQYDQSATPSGGGAYLRLRDQAFGQIVNSSFWVNRAESTFAGASARAGGLYVTVDDDASFELRRTTIGYNEADAGPGTNPSAAGLYLGLAGGRTTVADVRLESNDLQGLDGITYPPSAMDLLSWFSSSVVLDRLQFLRNDVGEPAMDLRLDVSTTGTVVARNILVANGPMRGALVGASSGNASLAHWTVTGHSTEGLRLTHSSPDPLRLDNSLLWGNGTDLAQTGSPIVDPSNLIGVNPLFVAPIADDYSLAAGSPAVDFGDKTLASMSRLDAAHAPRLDGADTDAGAYERGAIFGDGFEAGIVGNCQP